MSAPTALEDGALAHALAVRVPRQREAPGDRRGTGRSMPDRRRADAVAALTRTHDVLCTHAVDASEIAAGLEAAGVGDRHARAQYGVGNVFELAELMFDVAPRRPRPVEVAVDPWRRPWEVHAVRGVLYAAPALLQVLALHLAAGAVAGGALLLATVVGGAVTQGLALLGHALLGRAQQRAAGRLLRGAVLVLGPGLGAVAVGCVLWAGLPLGTGLVAAWLLSHLVAATGLLVLGAERRLLALLAPGAAVSAAALPGAVQVPDAALALVLVATVLASSVAVVLLSPRGAPGRRLRDVVDGGLVRLAATHAAAGALTTLLVAVVVLDALSGHGSPTAHAVAFAMAPLVAGLGLADLLVHRLRSWAHAALGEHTDLLAFRREAARAVARAVAVHTTALAALTGVGVTALAVVGRTPDRLLLLDAVVLDLLGIALLCCMVLLSLGRHAPVLLVGAAAVTADAAVRAAVALGDVGQRAADVLLTAAHLGTAAGVLALLVPLACTTLGDVVRHR